MNIDEDDTLKNQTAYLTLADGTVLTGSPFGAVGETVGEIVFATGMTGYLETLTDPSYYGQIILQTFPLIGNAGIIPADFESSQPCARAYIVRHPCPDPSNFRSQGTLDDFLRTRGIIGLTGIDTRALTKIIRQNGVLNGKITTEPPTAADRVEAAAYAITGAVPAVSAKTVSQTGQGAWRVVLLDCGAKRGIAAQLAARGCTVWTVPYDYPVELLLHLQPHGVVLSNGPGDPADPANHPAIETIRALLEQDVPIFGICLGHQLLALAQGYTTRKLKFGHRGTNQPVREQATGRAYITSQNHGYTVVTGDRKDHHETFVNLHDQTCEGLDYGTSFSVQFHPEACGGPLDTSFLFDRFIERMARHATR